MNPSPRDEGVLGVVALIPAGALVAYGDVADLLGECGVECTPRQVARCLSQFGSQVPWWRVVQSGGTIAEQVLPQARERLAAEGVATDGRRVDLEGRRWHPDLAWLRAELVRSGVL
ncbi:MAG TPA: MGMT family protein [Actinomycetota bacterium]|mgnify:FL=1|nr:MGMT family protein [Actinomycetota bacterium]HNO14887.1 MGMT family protein [Actinomycetota bacterium]HUM86088.1 MGMT family protein [Actinomycetota bacterium]